MTSSHRHASLPASDNPYVGVGQEATGERFIGRLEMVRRVQGVWQRPGRPSNLRVLGHHRVGKTSLVRHALNTSTVPRAELLTVWLNVGNHVSGADLFRSMSRQVMERLDISVRRDPSAAELVESLHAINAAVQLSVDWYDLSEATKRFFATLTDAGYSALVVLDEFDRASTALTSLAEFQCLRTLASESQYSFGLITISRQHIESIEIDAMGGSILGGVVVVPEYVGMFTDTETDLMLARAAEVGVGLASVRSEIIDLAGRHPFLTEVLCNRLVALYRSDGEVDTSAAYLAEIHAFETQFRQLVHNINSETGGRGLVMLQRIAAGRPLDLPLIDLQHLRLMGIVFGKGSGTSLFSAEFGRFVLTHNRDGH
ncbi:AAA ATPase domain-containing protein [Nocardia amikacinitolerans]|uniref:AAA ATPase domain-containing protein n=1 Tax=Nocardia amikacinitolerans TaxID=756689 RepID=A0A285L6A6_9NOCA|nr:ATP-binding protein [Nocardia amikacinitolerans]MCP2297004.1 AAA ATPase domain-containing protein [Nocardia amikacinitolerans]SNY80422.1 AAA ATPase domain-containing protein [Nocardia amikacinitolerans]